MKRSTIFFIVSLVFYAAFIAGFIRGTNRIYSVVWMCLGFVFLVIGNQQKRKENDDENSKKRK